MNSQEPKAGDILEILSDERKRSFLNIDGFGRPLKSPVTGETISRARQHRISRLRAEMKRQDSSTLILYNPINIRYAFDYANMQIWTMHEMLRHALIFAEGPAIMFEFKGCEHLCGLGASIDDVRTATGYIYMAHGDDAGRRAELWADEISSLHRQHGRGGRLAVDRIEPSGLTALQARDPHAENHGARTLHQERRRNRDDAVDDPRRRKRRGVPYWADIGQRAYDADKARFHLKQAGMSDLKVELFGAEAAFAGATDACLLFAEQARKAGIEIAVNRAPNDGYWSNVWNKEPFCITLWVARPTPDMIFSTAYASGVDWNESQFSSPRFDELLVAARAEVDEKKRAGMYREMQTIVRDDGNTIVPMFQNHVFARSASVDHGPIANNAPIDGNRAMERWWFKA